MVGSSSTLMFTFIKKVLSSTGKTFKSTYRTGFYGKSSISVGTITGIKINLTSEDCHWKVIAQPKPKVYLLKITLVNINEEVKGVNWIQLNKLNQFEFPHHSHNQTNISTL